MKLPVPEIVPLIGTTVPLATPWMEITSVEGVPATPNKGCLEEVAAPLGRGREVAETANVPLPALAVTVPLIG